MEPFIKKTEIITQNQNNNLQTYDMSQYAGRGLENITRDDMERPILTLLQGLSKQVISGTEDSVDGAISGSFYCAANNQIYSNECVDKGPNYPKPLVLIFVCMKVREIEYLRDQKGFVAEHLLGSKLTENISIEIGQNDKRERITTNDTVLVNTTIYYCLILDKVNEPTEAVISLSATGKKFATKLNSHFKSMQIPDMHGNLYTPPMFAATYKISSILSTSKRNGKKYNAWVFEQDLILDRAKSEDEFLFQKAIKYLTAVETDNVKVNHNEDLN